MKIKKFKFKQILKLHLLKSRIYEQFMKKNNSLVGLTLNQIINNLKKSLQIIFQYHQEEKRILFIGVPKKLEININKLTTHIAVSYNHNLQGMFSNNIGNFGVEKESNKNLSNSTYLLPKLFKKPDLVVFFCHKKAESVIQEISSSKIPLIILDDSKNFNNIDSSTFIYDNNIYFISLNFLFKIIKNKPKNLNRI